MAKDYSKMSDAELDAELAKVQKPTPSNTVDYSKLSDAELDAAIAAKMRPVASAPIKKDPMSASDLGRLAAQGATQGFGDEITGAIQAATEHFLPDDDVTQQLKEKGFNVQSVADKESLLDTYRRVRNQERLRDEEAKSRSGKLGTAAEIAGGVLTGSLIPGGAIKGLGKLAATSAAMGAANALGQSGADLTTGEAQDFAKAGVDTALGAGIGAALPVGIAGVGAGINAASSASQKLAPLGKKILSKLTGLDDQSIEEVLKNPSAVRSAPSTQDLGGQTAATINKLASSINDLNQQAGAKLSSEKNIPLSLLDELKNKVTFNPADKAAFERGLNSFINEQKSNFGKLVERPLEQQSPSVYEELMGKLGTPIEQEAPQMVKQLEGSLSQQDLHSMLTRLGSKAYDAKSGLVKDTEAANILSALKSKVSDYLQEQNPEYQQLVAQLPEKYNAYNAAKKLFKPHVGDETTEGLTDQFVEGSLAPMEISDTFLTKLKQLADSDKVDAKNVIDQLAKTTSNPELADAAKYYGYKSQLDKIAPFTDKLTDVRAFLGALGLGLTHGPLGAAAFAAPEIAKTAVKYSDIPGQIGSKIASSVAPTLENGVAKSLASGIKSNQAAILQDSINNSTPATHDKEVNALASDDKINDLQQRATSMNINAFASALDRIKGQDPETRRRSMQMLLQQPAFRKFAGME